MAHVVRDIKQIFSPQTIRTAHTEQLKDGRLQLNWIILQLLGVNWLFCVTITHRSLISFAIKYGHWHLCICGKALTHVGRMTHICTIRTLLVPEMVCCSAQNHCLNQHWLIIDQTLRNKLRWHFNQTLQWRHNGRDGVSNHQPHECLLNRLSRRRSKKTSKLRVTGLCAGNSPVIGEFTTQRASNAENVFISWRHLEYTQIIQEMLLKIASVKRQPSCPRLSAFTNWSQK